MRVGTDLTKAEIDLMRTGLTRAGTATLTRMGTDSGYRTDNTMTETETEMDHPIPTQVELCRYSFQYCAQAIMFCTLLALPIAGDDRRNHWPPKTLSAIKARVP